MKRVLGIVLGFFLCILTTVVIGLAFIRSVDDEGYSGHFTLANVEIVVLCLWTALLSVGWAKVITFHTDRRMAVVGRALLIASALWAMMIPLGIPRITRGDTSTGTRVAVDTTTISSAKTTLSIVMLAACLAMFIFVRSRLKVDSIPGSGAEETA